MPEAPVSAVVVQMCSDLVFDRPWSHLLVASPPLSHLLFGRPLSHLLFGRPSAEGHPSSSEVLWSAKSQHSQFFFKHQKCLQAHVNLRCVVSLRYLARSC